MSVAGPAQAFAHNHDHQRCINTALATAVTLCRARRCRLTPVRKRVLELVWQSHKPLGAYQLLAQLGEEGFNSAPPTVYRALDFLLEQGLVHRIASLNAFVGCSNPRHDHSGCFLICRICGSAQELAPEALSGAVQTVADSEGFAVESQTLELIGRCPGCREDQP